MADLLLVRQFQPDNEFGCNIGFLKAYDNSMTDEIAWTCWTLELPWMNNERNVSCIPPGTYPVIRDRTGKHRYAKILHVHQRDDIEIHPGNYLEETEGCPLPSENFHLDPITGRFYTSGSRTACETLRSWLDSHGGEATLDVRWGHS